jgi:HD-GYP domain-containing protein (c-di-GMP phosphodiesterase class II)
VAIKQVQISANDVAVGMFVSRLDRPWTQTPFPIQGLMVREQSEINSLRAYCDYVYIDVTKGRGPLSGAASISQLRHQEPEFLQATHSPSPIVRVPKRPKNSSVKPLVVKHNVYQTTESLRAESRNAERVLLNLRGSFTLAAKQLAKGRDFNYIALKQHVDDMVDSVIRCPDAFTWLMRLRLKDQHSHDHSLRSALWAVQFARYIGLPKADISALCLGTLLKDIGKVKLDNTLLRKQHRSPEEEKEYQRFVEFGVAMLREAGNVEPRVIAVVRYHCERFDGGGFPEAVAGEKIPLLARMAGIATTYDAVSNPRECPDPVAPSRAISLIYNMRGRQFQEDLVVEFIQSVGLYPTGTMVELTTGDIGVVMAQYPKSRLTPQVAVINTQSEAGNDSYTLVELKDEGAARKTLKKAGSKLADSVNKLAIARDLEPSGYAVDYRKVSGLVMDCSYSSAMADLGGSSTAKALGQKLLGGLRLRSQL